MDYNKGAGRELSLRLPFIVLKCIYQAIFCSFPSEHASTTLII